MFVHKIYSENNLGMGLAITCCLTIPQLEFLCFQKVFASRKELLEYDLQQREAATKSSRTTAQPTFTASQYRALSVLGCGHTSSTKCYGCASAVTEHCITLLRALATNSAIRHILVSQGLIRELFDYNLRRGTAAMREEVRQLMCLLTRLDVSRCLQPCDSQRALESHLH